MGRYTGQEFINPKKALCMQFFIFTTSWEVIGQVAWALITVVVLVLQGCKLWKLHAPDLDKASDAREGHGIASRLFHFTVYSLVVGVPLWNGLSDFTARYTDAATPNSVLVAALVGLLAVGGGLMWAGIRMGNKFKAKRIARQSMP